MWAPHLHRSSGGGNFASRLNLPGCPWRACSLASLLPDRHSAPDSFHSQEGFMSIRLISCGALILGAALLGTSCAPTADAQQTSAEEKTADGAFCGGIAAIQCPEGYTCVDDPSDSCDPAQGGA